MSDEIHYINDVERGNSNPSPNPNPNPTPNPNANPNPNPNPNPKQVERGTVWEETLMHLPNTVQMVALSATLVSG